MNDATRRAIVRWMPPVLVDAIRKQRRRQIAIKKSEQGRERGSSYYDATFESNSSFKVHYTASRYFFIWSVIADRIAMGDATSVLDVGCGSGQLASLLSDRGVQSYRGVDFSQQRIAWAQASSPRQEFAFEEADVFESDLATPVDVVVCTEFLEHVERDLELFGRLAPATRFIGSVPNFSAPGHVRFFDDSSQVQERYSKALSGLRVDRLAADPEGRHVYFLLDGVTPSA